MDLAHLRHFLKIVEHGSFTRAAADCGLSQPALSQQVARLEAELGRPVFTRQGRQVRLTEAGELLRARATQVLDLVDDTTRQVRDDGRTGRVVVAAIPTIAPYLVPLVIRAFRDAHPLARVEVTEAVTDDLVALCGRGEVDLGLLALPAEAPRLELEPLFDEELLLVLPAGHPLADRPEVSLEEALREPLILLDEAHCLAGQIRRFCRRRSSQPIAAGRVGQLATVRELVALGLGLSFVPAMAGRVDPDPVRVYRPVAPPRPARTIAVVSNPHRYRPGLVTAFLGALRTLAPPGAEPTAPRSA